MTPNQDLNSLVPTSTIRGYLESPQAGLMEAQESEEIDFENVTNKVALLSVALTDITRQTERVVGAGLTDLNAVSAQLANLHAKIGEDLVYTNAAWSPHADIHFVQCDSIQSTRVRRTLTAPGRKPRCKPYPSAFVTKLPPHRIQVSTVANCKLIGLPPTPSRFLLHSSPFSPSSLIPSLFIILLIVSEDL